MSVCLSHAGGIWQNGQTEDYAAISTQRSDPSILNSDAKGRGEIPMG